MASACEEEEEAEVVFHLWVAEAGEEEALEEAADHQGRIRIKGAKAIRPRPALIVE